MTDENKTDESNNNDLEAKLAEANERIEQVEIKLTNILENEKRMRQ